MYNIYFTSLKHILLLNGILEILHSVKISNNHHMQKLFPSEEKVFQRPDNNASRTLEHSNSHTFPLVREAFRCSL